MKVYKYRGAGKDLERDLNSISENYFYAPNAEKLNDPCETLVFSDRIQNQTKLVGKIFGKKSKESLINLHSALDNFVSSKKDVGIYSLSKTYDDELLWAHYANNHQGFCIEYDFDSLMDKNSFYNFYSFDVEYSSQPPQIDIRDVSSGDDNKVLLKKIAGTKSQRWSNEKEIRIITDKYGEHDYNFLAVKAIYFGYRMPVDDKLKVMERLAGRGLKYFQINLIDKTYSFVKEQIPDSFENSKKYLFKLYRNENGIISYKIHEIDYQQPSKKGVLSIILDTKITKEELGELGDGLKKKLFRSAERVFIFYYLKSDIMRSYAWGLTHFEESKETIEINGITSEIEASFFEHINNDNRLVIGHWIDEFNLKSLLTIYRDNGKVFLEILFKDNGNLTKEQVVTKVKGGVKYQDIDDKHGEYIIVDEKGLLSYYSEDGIFNKIEKTTYNNV